MRIAFLVLAASLAASLGGCASEPALVSTPASAPPGQTGSPSASQPVSPANGLIPEPVLPDYKPETAAACNAVRMSVDLAVDGSIKVNGAASDLTGVKAAAARKNAACANAPAMVGLAVAKGVPAARSDALRDVLSTAIANIALVEVTTE